MDNHEIKLQCTICLEQFTKPVVLDCGHTFDSHCIKNQELCPVCRKKYTRSVVNWEIVKYFDISIHDNVVKEEGINQSLLPTTNVRDFRSKLFRIFLYLCASVDFSFCIVLFVLYSSGIRFEDMIIWIILISIFTPFLLIVLCIKINSRNRNLT